MWKVKQKCVLCPTRRESDKNVKFQPRKKNGEISFAVNPLTGTILSRTMTEKVELWGYSRHPWDSTNHGSDILHAVVFLF